MPHQPEFVRYETRRTASARSPSTGPRSTPTTRSSTSSSSRHGRPARAMPTRACSCSGPWASTSAPARCSTGHHGRRLRTPSRSSDWDELEFVRDLAKPTIAAVQGGCIGGGQRFVFPCDLIFCSEDAFFRDPLVGGRWHRRNPGTRSTPGSTDRAWPRRCCSPACACPRPGCTRWVRSTVSTRVRRCTTRPRRSPGRSRQADPLALRQAKRAVNTTMDIQGQHYIRNRFAELMDASPRLDLGRA